MSFPTQKYDVFLCLDFEATCQERGCIEPQEIIEFPCIAISADTFQEVGRFHEYVQPVGQPLLTDFCTQLTGITQSMVSDRKQFPEVVADFLNWYAMLGFEQKRSIFLTCGDWDLATMLPKQCKYSGIPVPPCLAVSAGSFVNIKTSFQRFTGTEAPVMCWNQWCWETERIRISITGF